eukprot:4932483-Pleurochrysis_carterae.AAC.1
MYRDLDIVFWHERSLSSRTAMRCCRTKSSDVSLRAVLLSSPARSGLARNSRDICSYAQLARLRSCVRNGVNVALLLRKQSTVIRPMAAPLRSIIGFGMFSYFLKHRAALRGARQLRAALLPHHTKACGA